MLIQVAAIFNLAFGIFHLFFWVLLDWPGQLKRLSHVNRAVTQTLNICLTFMFFLFAGEFHSSNIGNVLLIGMALFWCIRALLQIFLFNLSERIHQFLLLLFIIGSILYLLPLFFNAFFMASTIV